MRDARYTLKINDLMLTITRDRTLTIDDLMLGITRDHLHVSIADGEFATNITIDQAAIVAGWLLAWVRSCEAAQETTP